MGLDNVPGEILSTTSIIIIWQN